MSRLTDRRREEVAKGNCGHCYRPRNRFKFLCDDCATKHRERQRRPLSDKERLLALEKLLAYIKEKRR